MGKAVSIPTAPTATPAMRGGDDAPAQTGTVAPGPPPASHKRAIVRRSAALLAATAALVAFILLLGDMRRRNVAMERAQRFAEQLTGRVGQDGVLPLNLEPAPAAGQPAGGFRFTWLTRDEAHRLRGSHERILAAYSPGIECNLSPDGRAVLFFESGRFGAAWVSEKEFTALNAAQQRLLEPDAPHAQTGAR
ncbi:MAG: hypothetical protein HY763_03340 [Planctomycetes bacterium]|nr:hypothetical protein [Planctomycetota bacterium]